MSPQKSYSVESANDQNPKLIIGVYSTNPVVIGNASAEEDPENHVLVGLMGVVPAKVNTENGSIKIGDFVTISSKKGVAMKATRSGYVIGKALENYSGNTQGMIKVLVKPEWIDLGGQIVVLKSAYNELENKYESLLKRVEQLEASMNQ